MTAVISPAGGAARDLVAAVPKAFATGGPRTDREALVRARDWVAEHCLRDSPALGRRTVRPGREEPLAGYRAVVERLVAEGDDEARGFLL